MASVSPIKLKVELDELSVKRLGVAPGDTVILTHRGRLDPGIAQSLADRLAAVFADNYVVVLDDDHELSLLHEHLAERNLVAVTREVIDYLAAAVGATVDWSEPGRPVIAKSEPQS